MISGMRFYQQIFPVRIIGLRSAYLLYWKSFYSIKIVSERKPDPYLYVAVDCSGHLLNPLNSTRLCCPASALRSTLIFKKAFQLRNVISLTKHQHLICNFNTNTSPTSYTHKHHHVQHKILRTLSAQGHKSIDILSPPNSCTSSIILYPSSMETITNTNHVCIFDINQSEGSW